MFSDVKSKTEQNSEQPKVTKVRKSRSNRLVQEMDISPHKMENHMVEEQQEKTYDKKNRFLMKLRSTQEKADSRKLAINRTVHNCVTSSSTDVDFKANLLQSVLRTSNANSRFSKV